jgi:hypothetical protein
MDNCIFILPDNPTKCDDDFLLGEGNVPGTVDSAPI